MKRNILILLLLIFSVPAVFCETENLNSVFNKANELYMKNDFTGAVRSYEYIRKNSNPSYELYCNLANAYYKNDEIGYAILNFERALKLSPRDEDARFNLDLLYRFSDTPPMPFGYILKKNTLYFLSINEFSYLFTFFMLLFAFSFGIYKFYEFRPVKTVMFASIAFLVIIAPLFIARIYDESESREAIIVLGPAEIKNSPDNTSSTAFSLPAGRKLNILSKKDNYYSVELINESLKGWLNEKYLQAI